MCVWGGGSLIPGCQENRHGVIEEGVYPHAASPSLQQQKPLGWYQDQGCCWSQSLTRMGTKGTLP